MGIYYSNNMFILYVVDVVRVAVGARKATGKTIDADPDPLHRKSPLSESA